MAVSGTLVSLPGAVAVAAGQYKYRFVELTGAAVGVEEGQGYEVQIATGTVPPIGVGYTDATVAREAIQVVTEGRPVKVVAGADLSAAVGQAVASDATGQAVLAGAGATIMGLVLKGAVAGDLAEIYMNGPHGTA